jgi:hypothetical protein
MESCTLFRSFVALLLAIGVSALPLRAGAGNGTLDLAPEADWAVPISDSEMAEMRGGLGGLAFNIAFTGYIDDLGNVDGNFQFGPEGVVPVGPPDFDFSNGDALISTQIGDFQGFEGIAQIQLVPGNFNFVQQNLFVQVVVVNGAADGLSLSSFFPSLP